MKRYILVFSVLLISVALNAQAPVANFSADTNFTCAGQTLGFFDLSTNGPTAWSWTFPGGTPSTSNLQNPTITYNTPGVYSVTLTATNGSGSDTFTRTNYITVNGPPTTSNAGPDQTVCVTTASVTLAGNTPTVGVGQWTVINGSGTFANSFSPTTSVTGMSIGVNTYQWTIANDPCPNSIDQVVITVDDVPTTANAGPDQQLCATTTTSFSGNTQTIGTGTWTLISGSGTITNPNQPNSQVTGLSAGPNVFQWTISNGACNPSTDLVTITVNSAPTISINPNIVNLCIGQSINLTASGASSYAWSPSTGLNNTTTATVTATPTATITYMVVGTDVNGCTASSTVTVFVNAYPTVTVSPTSANVCSNQPIALSASGAPLYSWSPSAGLSATTGANVNALPTTTTTTYMVIGNNNACMDTATVTLTSIPAPVATVNPSNTLICSGNNVSLSAGGGISYSWMPSQNLSSTTASTVTANPTTSTSYSVIVTAANGCSDTAVAVVGVNQPPNVTVNPPTGTICAGDTISLTATGAQTYSWAPAAGLNTTTGANVMAFPTVTTTYTVTGTTPSCGNSVKLVTITVNPLPAVTVTPSSVAICQGSFVNLNASGASTYSWSPSTGLSSTTGAVVTANPTTATTYYCTGTSAAGCSSTVIANVNVNPIFALNASTTPVICGNGNNGTATVTPNGGTPPFTYQWNDPFSQTTPTAYGLSAGNYSVVVTDANGRSQSTVVTVSNINPMSMNIAYTNALCFGSNNGTATVTVSGGNNPYTYSWSDPLNQNTAMAP